MAVRIPLKRLGRLNRPSYRICVFDSRTRRDGCAIEELGIYETLTDDPARKLRVDVDRARHWLSKGAKPTEIVHMLFKKTGVYQKAQAAS